MSLSLNIMTRVAFETLRISVPTMLDAVRGNVSSRVCDERLNSWSRKLLDEAGISLRVSGLDHIVKGQAYVVMSNHQSHYDIPVLYQALQMPMRMVAKKELFRIPIMAGAMRAAGFVKVDRGNRHSAIEALISAREQLCESTSIWIAPEGTRSRTGCLGPFKKGGFRLALSCGMQILPITIDGTRETLPAGRLTVNRGATVKVTVSPPVDPVAYGSANIHFLIAVVRDVIADHLPCAAVRLESGEER